MVLVLCDMGCAPRKSMGCVVGVYGALSKGSQKEMSTGMRHERSQMSFVLCRASGPKGIMQHIPPSLPPIKTSTSAQQKPAKSKQPITQQ